MALFKIIEPNLKGRDFVVGDIHGTYDRLDKAMMQVGFDYVNDRVISVGDLVDRGPDSPRCLEFLQQPWFHAIRGNHEDMLLDVFATGECDGKKLMGNIRNGNGLEWVLRTPSKTLYKIVEAFSELPIAMQVETPRGLVGFVHGDVPSGMDWKTFTAKIEAGDRQAVQTALWGRRRITSNNHDGVPGVGRVYVGHTPLEGGLRRYGNVYAIDTGAVFHDLDMMDDGRLTFAHIQTATTTYDQPRPARPVDVRADIPPQKPFGHYAKGPNTVH